MTSGIRPRQPFTGSYLEGDVDFLLRPLAMEPLSLKEREQKVASGVAHYSEMIGEELAPDRARLQLFRRVLEARNLGTLASHLAAREGPLTLVSIARAGTPVGVILKRLVGGLLSDERREKLEHYSISVIRDYGIDLEALSIILEKHPAEGIVFVDGWTGKGTIATEIRKSLAAAGERFRGIDPGLWAPVDMAGMAIASATREDQIIPSALLGGTISGLVSRSILPRSERHENLLHGCLELDHLRRVDLSRWFVDEITPLAMRFAKPAGEVAPLIAADPAVQERMTSFVEETARTHGLASRNQVKIGLGETVRAAIRRIPECIIVRDLESPGAQILSELSAARQISLVLQASMPVASAAILGGKRIAPIAP